MIDNNSKEFIYRHIGPTEAEQKNMLKDNIHGLNTNFYQILFLK